MFDMLEHYYKCEHTRTCETCKYFDICILVTRMSYCAFEDIDKLFTIHYAEGEI